MKKSISELIKETLLQQGHRSIRVDDTNFFLSLVTGTGKNGEPRLKGSVGWRIVWFGIFVSSVFFLLFLLIYATTFFIKDILLFDEKPIVTEAGAIIPQRSCNREQVLFHFNAAELWARTGVQLQKGDRIKISHSGGFHSDITDIYLKARENGLLKYPYYTGFTELSSSGVENCIYNRVNTGDVPWWCSFLSRKRAAERTPCFGSILWQVADENSVLRSGPDDIHQIGKSDAKNFIRIRKDGELFLTVNDILLSDTLAERINQNKMKLWKSVPDSIGNDPYWAREHDLDYIGISVNDRDSLLYEAKDIRAYLAKHPELRDIWFHDNIGSVLICVEIQRKVGTIHVFTRWFRNTERRMNWACDDRGVMAGIFLSACVCSVSVVLFCWPPLLLLLIYFFPKIRKRWLNWRKNPASTENESWSCRMQKKRRELYAKFRKELRYWWDDTPAGERS